MSNSNQSFASDLEFSTSFSDEDGYISHTTDYLSTDNEEERCSTCQDTPPKNGVNDSVSEQKDGPSFEDSSSAHVEDLPSTSKLGDSSSSVTGPFIHLVNDTGLHDLEGCGPPRKKAKVGLLDLEGCGPPRKKAKVGSSKKTIHDYVPAKRSNLTAKATNILKNCLLQHLKYPYPTEETKVKLACRAGLSLVQVNNWLTNARRRHYTVWCHQRGLEPMLVKRNRKGSNGSQSSSPKSENKENEDPVSHSGLNRNFSEASVSFLPDAANVYEESENRSMEEGQSQAHRDTRMLVINPRFQSNRSSSSSDLEFAATFSDEDMGISRTTRNLSTDSGSSQNSSEFTVMAALYFLSEVAYIYEESEIRAAQVGLSQVAWVKKILRGD